MSELTGGIWKGAVAGVIFSQAQYWKKTDRPEFDAKKLVVTTILGAVGGVLAEYTGTDISTQYTMLVSGGFAVIVENGVKLLWRKFFRK